MLANASRKNGFVVTHKLPSQKAHRGVQCLGLGLYLMIKSAHVWLLNGGQKRKVKSCDIANPKNLRYANSVIRSYILLSTEI